MSLPKPEALVGEVVQGSLRSFKGQWGFAISDAFKGDVFCHSDYAQAGTILATGQPIQFTVGFDKKGRVAAMDTCNVDVMEAEEHIAGEEQFAEEEFAEGEAEYEEAVPDALAKPAELVGAGRIIGSIRSWKKDWGFVISDSYEGDAFMNIQNNLTFQGTPGEGVTIEFELDYDRRNRVTVTNATIPNFLPAARTAQTSIGHRTAIASRSSLPRSASSRAGLAAVAGPSYQTTRFPIRSSLAIARSSPYAAAATVARPRTASRPLAPVPLRERTRPTQQIGLLRPTPAVGVPWSRTATVRNTAPIGNFAPVSARKQTTLSSNSAAAKLGTEIDTLIGETVEGSVRSWKGLWGFVISDVFEGDIFAHRDNLTDQEWVPAGGDAVSFSLARDTRNRVCAHDICAI